MNERKPSLEVGLLFFIIAVGSAMTAVAFGAPPAVIVIALLATWAYNHRGCCW